MSRIRADKLVNRVGSGGPTFPNGVADGFSVTGVVTATSFSGPVTGNITGNLTGDLTGNVTGNLTGDVNATNINVTGISTLGNVLVGGATTDVVINGDLRVTGIITTGTASITIDPEGEKIVVGSALTLGHTQGVQFHTQSLHSDGFDVNNINVSGIVTAANVSVGNSITATTFYGSGANLDGIDSTAITNGTSNVTVSENANINVVRSGTTRLSINEAGINVTGEAVVDGLDLGNGELNVGTGSIFGGTSKQTYISKGNAGVQVYVSDSGNDSTGTGESNSPVRTISRACELLPKVLGNQHLEIRIQGSSYTTTNGGQNIKGFSFDGSDQIGPYLRILADSGTVTFSLQHAFQMHNVHGFRIENIAFVVPDAYAGGVSFYSCSMGRIYNSCSFESSSNYGWSERIAFLNCFDIDWQADCTLTAQASAGLGGFVTITNGSIDWGGDIVKSGTRFGNHAICAFDNAMLKMGGCVINNFQNGITGGNNHYNNEAGARIVVNSVIVQNCVTGVYLRNMSHLRKYNISYSGNSTNELITSNSQTD